MHMHMHMHTCTCNAHAHVHAHDLCMCIVFFLKGKTNGAPEGTGTHNKLFSVHSSVWGPRLHVPGAGETKSAGTVDGIMTMNGYLGGDQGRVWLGQELGRVP